MNFFFPGSLRWFGGLCRDEILGDFTLGEFILWAVCKFADETCGSNGIKGLLCFVMDFIVGCNGLIPKCGPFDVVFPWIDKCNAVSTFSANGIFNLVKEQYPEYLEYFFFRCFRNVLRNSL